MRIRSGLTLVALVAFATVACKREHRAPAAAPPPVPPAMGDAGPAMPPPGEGAPDSAALAGPHRAAAGGPIDVKVEPVPKASGPDARTVAELWAQRKGLAGKTVAVRGKVVKSTPVMGRNFLHLRDGSGSDAQHDNDLTVTSGVAVPVGQVVTVRGVVGLDRDFGVGTPYPVVLEDAKVTK